MRHDTPARLLDLALRWMPTDRSEWGVAMRAELAQFDDPALRWSFALGCVRTVLFLPRRIESTHTAAPGVHGALLVMPFVVLNAIVANRIEPFFSVIRPGEHTSAQEYLLLAVSLLLLPLGAYQFVRPLLREWGQRKPKFIVWNLAIALVIGAAFVAISLELGSEIYRCDVLGLTNCD
jgi:hypothetical protein